MLSLLSLHPGSPDIMQAEGGKSVQGQSMVATMASVASFALPDAQKCCEREGERSGTEEQRIVRHRN